MNRPRLFFVLICSLICSCAPKQVSTPPRTSKIRRVAVLPFQGAGGPLLRNEIIRRLLAMGLEVLDHSKGVDAVFSGVVTSYQPEKRLTVFLGRATAMPPSGPTLTVTNPILSSLNASAVAPDGTTFIMPNAQMMAVCASIDATMRLTTAGALTVLWSDSFAYEGIDAQTALQGATGLFMESLQHSLAGSLLRG